MRSSRNSTVAALALIAVVIDGASSSAHRRDEYLQAARLAIDPSRVEIELDLTPGISVADTVLREIDADGSASISPAEAHAYAARVLDGIHLDLDGRSLSAHVTDTSFPAVDAMRRGEGSIRLQIAAPAPPLAAGVHHLRYANRHRADIGAYLANALVPSSARIAITDQQRDVDQRHLDVAYVLHAEPAGSSRWPLAVLALGSILAGLGIAGRRQIQTRTEATAAGRQLKISR